MADDHDVETGPPPDPNAGHEKRDISIKSVVLFGVSLTVAAVAFTSPSGCCGVSSIVPPTVRTPTQYPLARCDAVTAAAGAAPAGAAARGD